MMPIQENNRPAARGLSEPHAAGILRSEGGFVLAFVMFLLAVCTLLGLAASQTSIDETDISSNEVITRKVYTMALSGLPLAAIPLLKTQGRGDISWTAATKDNPVYLDNKNSEEESESGVIQILGGNFLLEGREEDASNDTGWNNAGKYLCNGKNAAYKPIDDPFQKRKANGTLYDATIDDTPDMRIRSDNQLTIDIDVDKASVGYLAGGVAEFGSGAEGSTGAAMKFTYVLDCKATLPGREVGAALSPTAEMVLGYRFIPDSGT
jgi:hypothetical protein